MQLDFDTIHYDIKPVFSRTFSDFGTISLRHFRITEDSKALHKWVNMDYAVFWGMQGNTLKEVEQEYARLMQPEHYDVFVGEYHGDVVFVLEKYNPKYDSVGQLYPVKNTDAGIHIIVAPPKHKIQHFTWYMFSTIMDFVFQDKGVQRILVEPDIRNKKMFALCQRIGFNLDKVIELPHKTAQLAFLDRNHFYQKINNSNIKKRSAMNTLDHSISPQQSVSHLQLGVWEKANILLVKKAIVEFSHELLITPKATDSLGGNWYNYLLKADNDTITYTFKAKLLKMNHLQLEADALKKYDKDQEVPLDAIAFIKEFRKQLGIADTQLPLYLEEIISTLYGSVFKLQKGNPLSQHLVNTDFQTIEQSMAEGHPGFVANNGRIGFDSSDYRAYAPEAGNSFSILWLAGHKTKTVYAATEDLPYKTVIAQELDQATIASFNSIIAQKGQNPEDYKFIPMHPWQWFNKLSTIFAPEIAKGDLICLGYGPDQYHAQQSIRTLFNVTNPHKFYTKTALSILNMGFMRGLPLYYLGTAPKMAVWLENLLYNDTYIKETGFRMLSEVASVSYVNPYYEEFGVHNDYNKMLASLWRESPYKAIKEDQQLMTMAAFLHVDHEDDAFLPRLIEASGITTEQWLKHYFKAYLSPLLHCFYHFDLVFMPHGENLIMVLENHIPVSALLKDITEEACILNPEVQLPEHLKRMYAPVPEDVKLLSIFTDIFDGFFRFMSHILEAYANFPEDKFWQLVAETITTYQERYPEHSAKFKQYDLFASDFHLSCLNRLQLNNHKQMIDLDDPVALLQFAGRLENPIAAFKNNAVALNTINL